MGALTYEYLGDRDLRDAKYLLEVGSWSQVGRLLEQAVEKHFKHYISKYGDSSDKMLLGSHNMVGLYNRFLELSGETVCCKTLADMSLLKDYYYDINYPGDNCRELDEIEARNALDFVVPLISIIKQHYYKIEQSNSFGE